MFSAPKTAMGVAAIAMSFCAALAHADETRPGQPVWTPDGLVFPDGVAIPRSLTDVERDYLRENPLEALRGATPPPATTVRSVAEYEPMDAIIFSWSTVGSWNSIIAQMAGHITTTGNADVIVYARSTANANSALSAIAAQGADMSRVDVRVRFLDTIWLRDYGPRYVYQGDVRAVIDHTYNRPRPNDNALNTHHAALQGHAFYEMPLIHGGGNYHLNALNSGHATNLVVNENPGMTQSQVYDIWNEYQNIDTTFYTPFPTSVDSTQHIDMWMQIIGDNKIVISEWPAQQGSTQSNISNAAAAALAANGWTVYRTPAVRLTSSPAAHYTYTNVVVVNDLVLIPTYTHSFITGNNYNETALSVWQQAMPGKTIVQINCQSLVTAAGVMHCIVMHMPAHLGGDNPTAHVVTPNDAATFDPGDNVQITWLTDDREGVSNVDLLLSTDGGANFSTIAAAIPDTGSYNWTVPSVFTTQGVIRVVARNANNLTGHDDSDQFFTIGGPCPGDANGDGVVDFADLSTVLGNFGQSGAGVPGDVNGDGEVDFADLSEVLSNFGTEC
ncbi:MAG: hypothetical protein EA379_05585 [Phycisphaerales bacterium]|nr:MAG: hypothetical protein EA379_05585 [Phycisphaerales bacterium]